MGGPTAATAAVRSVRDQIPCGGAAVQGTGALRRAKRRGPPVLDLSGLLDVANYEMRPVRCEEREAALLQEEDTLRGEDILTFGHVEERDGSRIIAVRCATARSA
ncbi:hypothetical protein NL676_008127 [Syzygium grande]|nr:hypothetical protein NL676_008127 [Syzygium grande]